jgi:hypothetical protein
MYDQPDEIIVPHPKKLLLEHAINELLNGLELEVLLQGFCSEGSVDECWVEERDEKVFASWTESVHSGCRERLGVGTVVSEWGNWVARGPTGGQPFDASGAGIFEIDFEQSGRRSVHSSHLMPIEFASRF